MNFFNTFTDYKDNDFYITSESYGGHYIPTTAMRIIEGKDKSADGAALYARTKGFLIGNPAIHHGDGSGDSIPSLSTYFGHGLLSTKAWIQVTEACDYREYYTNCERDFTHPSEACKAA